MNESTLIWAVVCSILLHILFFVVVPNFKFDAIKRIPDQLTVEIMQPKPPEPVVIPEPPAPVEQVKPEPIKPLPKKIPKPEPAPIKDVSPEPVQHEPPPPPTVITAAPKVDAPPVITVPPPPPEPPVNTEPNEDEINSAKAAFTESIQNELRRNHRYPKIAAARGIQGEAKVSIVLDKEGNLVSATIIESSGNDTLDEGAIATVKRSNLKKLYPSILRGRTYTVTVPISFAIANP
ncbi:MAG: energy transducer TonB [Methylotenera sp.]